MSDVHEVEDSRELMVLAFEVKPGDLGKPLADLLKIAIEEGRCGSTLRSFSQSFAIDDQTRRGVKATIVKEAGDFLSRRMFG